MADVQVEIKINVEAISYKMFKRMVKAQSGEVPASEILDILDRCLVNDVDDLPAAVVVPMLVQAINAELTERMAQKN